MEENKNKAGGNPAGKDAKKKLNIVRSPESIAEQKQYINALDEVIFKFRSAKVPMNRTSLQKMAVGYSTQEGEKQKFVSYIMTRRANAKIEL